jgi:transposase InsO family protein
MSTSTLTDWNKYFDVNLQPYEKEEKRGKTVTVTAETIRLVVALAQKKLEKEERIFIESFTRGFNMAGEFSLGTETIREILIANDLWAVNTRIKRPAFYKNLCKRIPNGLLSIDGSEIKLNIDGEPYKYNLELGVDVGSFNHTGFDIGKSENSKAVLSVLKQHVRDYGYPLGVVFDHGTANLSEEVRTWLVEHNIEIVPAGPGNPKGNGTSEGAFSQLKKVLGIIELDCSTPENLGKSVLTALVALYMKMRNKLPLRKNSVTPQAVMEIEISEEVRQKERERLIQHNKNREDSGEELNKLETLHWIIQNHDLEVDTPSFRRAEYSIKSYSTDAIQKTEQAFLKAVDRNSDKKNLSYFFGILKNIQQELDDAQYHEYCREKYYYKSLLESERRQREDAKKQSKPSFDMIVDLASSALNVSGKVHKTVRNLCKAWLALHLKSSKYLEPVRKKIQDAIGTLNEVDAKTKEEIWDWIEPLLSK